MRSLRPYVVVGVLVAIIVAAFFAYTHISRIGKVPVNFVVAPSVANLYVNDSEIDHGVNYLSPGTYSVEASYEGFSEYSQSLVVKKDEVEQIVPIGLSPLTPEALEIFNQDIEAVLQVEGAIGAVEQQKGAEFAEENPIVTELPYSGISFRIDYSVSESEEVSLIINAQDDYSKEEALSLIRYWGYDPSDYSIEYTD